MLNTTSPPVPTVSGLASPAREWVVAAAAIAVGVCALAITFRAEIAAALRVWNDSDAFSHCYLVLPVAAYLAWDRRDRAMATPLRPTPALALLAIPVAAAWFAADRLGIMEARQLLAMSLFQIMVASICGLSMWRALSAPLLYLFFLVPFGDFLVPPLQRLAVHFTTAGLDLLGIPNFADGTTIQIPEGSYLIHQACSGLRFLIALMAFSVLYACLIYTSPLRRALFIAVSFAVAVIGNDLRVLGIIVIAHFISNNQAIETDHVLWGWLFYVIIGAVLVAIGLTFRQERRAPVHAKPQNQHRTLGASVVALALMLLLTTAPRVAANYMDQLGTDATAALAAPIGAPALSGCVMAPVPAAGSVPTAEIRADITVSQAIAYQCDGDLFTVTLHRYPPRISARTLFLSLIAAQTPPDADIIVQTDVRGGSGHDTPVWRLTESQKDGRFVSVATALWLDDHPAGAGIAARVDQALNTIRRSPFPPVVVVISHSERDGATNSRRALENFLTKTSVFPELVGQFAMAPAVRRG